MSQIARFSTSGLGTTGTAFEPFGVSGLNFHEAMIRQVGQTHLLCPVVSRFGSKNCSVVRVDGPLKRDVGCLMVEDSKESESAREDSGAETSTDDYGATLAPVVHIAGRYDATSGGFQHPQDLLAGFFRVTRRSS